MRHSSKARDELPAFNRDVSHHSVEPSQLLLKLFLILEDELETRCFNRLHEINFCCYNVCPTCVSKLFQKLFPTMGLMLLIYLFLITTVHMNLQQWLHASD